ncbi:ubiquitin protein ligase [Aureococcus anophagefferens]|nr:ubiquitin protein ligase [Aureococcus anophagefferens]
MPSRSQFSKGDRVEARFRGREKYAPGRIEATRFTGLHHLYDVTYDDGVRENRVGEDLIRAPTVAAPAAAPRQERAYLGDAAVYTLDDGIARWSVGRLKHFLDEAKVPHGDVVDKAELVARARRVVEDRPDLALEPMLAALESDTKEREAKIRARVAEEKWQHLEDEYNALKARVEEAFEAKLEAEVRALREEAEGKARKTRERVAREVAARQVREKFEKIAREKAERERAEREKAARAAAGAPPDWEEQRDASGRPYYVNHRTRTTSWTRPGAAPPAPPRAAAPLPPGWEEQRDATGRPYYVNHRTKTTSWTRPAPAPASPAAAPLPPGWEEQRDASGRPYYVNHRTQTTSWTHPAAAMRWKGGGP